MENESRTYNSSRNAFFAIICQVITLFLSFISRAIFIKYLSSTYLGLNGVFSNVISFLCLAELGVGNVLLYNLYKPLKENDDKKIRQILNLFKKYYIGIASIILILGILFIPFIPFILNGVDFSFSIIIIYLLFLINTVCSYLYAYKISLLTAAQKNYIVSKTTILVTIFKEGFQILVLLLTKNYYLFLAVTILSTITKNIVLSKKCDKLFANINIPTEPLTLNEQKKIKSDFKDIFLYKIANVALYSTDNILTSSLLKGGTILVGIYSNYLLITDSLNKLIGAMFQAFTASIGNLNSGNDNEKKYFVFKSLNFMANWIYGAVCACLLVLVNPFINIFAGPEYLFSFGIVLVIIGAFYIDGTFTPIWIFRETTGLFKKSKNIAIILALTNIILSIILGKIFGIIGILGATIISRLLTTYWYEPYIITRKYLNKSYLKYVLNNLKFIVKNIVVCIIIYFAFKNIVINNYLSFILYGILVFTVTNILLLILNFREQEFGYLMSKLKSLLKRG